MSIKPSVRAAVLILLTAGVLAAVWIRMVYGADVTDEVFVASEAYIVSNGARPVVDTWTQTPLTPLFNAPIVKLFVSWTGGTQGIMLFMRRAFFVGKAVVCVGLVLLLRRHMGLTSSWLFVLPFMAVFPYSLFLAHYDNLGLLFFMLSAVLLFAGLSQDSLRRGCLYMGLGGVTIAASVISNLSYSVCCLTLLIVLLVYARKQRRFSLFFSHIGAGAACVVALVVLLLVWAGGIENLLNSIHAMRAQPYYQLATIRDADYTRRQLLSLLAELSRFFGGMAVIFAIPCAIQAIRHKATAWRRIYVFSVVGGGAAYLVWAVVRPSVNLSALNEACLILLLIPFLLMPALRRNRAAGWRLLACFSLPSVVLYITYLLFMVSSVTYRMYMLLPGSLLAVPFSCFALWETMSDTQGFARAGQAAAFVLPALLCVFILSQHFGYVYIEEPISQLTYRVERGVYRGLYTTPQRGEALLHLEDTLQQVTSPDDRVLFLDLAPAAYLMTPAQVCAPSTWDITLYTNGFQSDYMLQEYFSITGREPTKIIYVERWDHKPMSIDDPAHTFNAYRDAHYELSSSHKAALFGVTVYERRPGH